MESRALVRPGVHRPSGIAPQHQITRQQCGSNRLLRYVNSQRDGMPMGFFDHLNGSK
jgi:hypothetical protein